MQNKQVKTMYKLTHYERKMMIIAGKVVSVMILIAALALSCDAIEAMLKP